MMVTLEHVSPGARIFYTLDGSDPSGERAIKYEGPFPLTATTQVRAIAVESGSGNGSGGLIGVSAGDGTRFLLSTASQKGSMSSAQDIVFDPPSALPEGLALSSSGVLSGTSAKVGTYRFKVMVTDANGMTAESGVDLVVASAYPAGFVVEDGVLTKYAGPGGDVVIPSDVTLIGSYAFMGCRGLTSVMIPSSVVNIETDAFASCPALKTVFVEAGDAQRVKALFSASGFVVDGVSFVEIGDEPPEEDFETFHYDGNGADSGSMADYVHKGGNFPLNQFVRAGYTFLGWSLDPEATEAEWGDGEMVEAWLYEPFTNMHTLYAVWSRCGDLLEIETGDYFKKSLAELGFDVPTNGTAYTVKAYGLPAGVKLVKSAAVTKKVKVAKVSGLPTGLAFAAANTYGHANAKKKTGRYLKQSGQTIVGTPTKAGTYVVTFTKNVKSGKKLFYASKKVQYRTYRMDALGTNDLSLKITPAGAVTATLAWDTGRKDKKKAIVYKPTCATVLLPTCGADVESDAFTGEVYLYFAPSASNSFAGFAACVPFPFGE